MCLSKLPREHSSLPGHVRGFIWSLLAPAVGASTPLRPEITKRLERKLNLWERWNVDSAVSPASLHNGVAVATSYMRHIASVKCTISAGSDNPLLTARKPAASLGGLCWTGRYTYRVVLAKGTGRFLTSHKLTSGPAESGLANRGEALAADSYSTVPCHRHSTDE